MNIDKIEKMDYDTQIELLKKMDCPIDGINKTNVIKYFIKCYKKKYPCNEIIETETDLIIKKHQFSVANQLVDERGVIVYHEVGTGKTLTAIVTSRCLMNMKIVKKCIFVTPTSLQENAKEQLLKYNIHIDIDKYVFYTITGLANAIHNKTVVKCNDALVIIDEAHNLRTADGQQYNAISKYCKNAKKILLLTATPLINYKTDIINLVSIARGEEPIRHEEFEQIILDKHKLKKYLQGVLNIYIKKSMAGFPSKKIHDIYLKMDASYYKKYTKVERGEIKKITDFKDNQNVHAFYNGVRRTANIIENKSIKIDWIINKLEKHKHKKFVIFSNYITMGNKPIMKYLDKHNIKYSVITGDMSKNKRKEQVNMYNNNEIKILFLSKSGAEGLDLKNTSYLIILEPSWNDNILTQIIGRCVRYESHHDLPKHKQKVTIYRLFLVKPNEYDMIKKITSELYLDLDGDLLSIDLYLKNYSIIKQIEIDKFYNMLKKSV